MNITGNTRYIAHIGYPTHTFKSPQIYNPYFSANNIDCVVIPFSSQAPDYPALLHALFRTGNIAGALITMPHKVTTAALADRLSPTAEIAGAVNAVRLGEDGKLEGDMFDGEGFVQAMRHNGYSPQGKTALVVGSGGVGSAIAASLAKAGVSALHLYDSNQTASETLAARLQKHYPTLTIRTQDKDPFGIDIIVNASPLGMNGSDPMPIDIARLNGESYVGDVVLKQETTAFLAAAQTRGCQTQAGIDMLFAQIPVYLEYFGLPVASPDILRRLAAL